MRAWPQGEWLETSEAKQRVIDVLRSTAPLVEWLNREVGESTEDAPVRGRR